VRAERHELLQLREELVSIRSSLQLHDAFRRQMRPESFIELERIHERRAAADFSWLNHFFCGMNDAQRVNGDSCR